MRSKSAALSCELRGLGFNDESLFESHIKRGIKSGKSVSDLFLGRTVQEQLVGYFSSKHWPLRSKKGVQHHYKIFGASRDDMEDVKRYVHRSIPDAWVSPISTKGTVTRKYKMSVVWNELRK